MLLKHDLRKVFFIITVFLLTSSAQSQIADFPADTVAGIPVNYTEAKVGDYSLPDPLVCSDGQSVDNAELWTNKRRSEIVALFEQHQFGKSPAGPKNIRFNVFDRGSLAFEGKAKRTQVTIYFSYNADEPKMDLLIYVPSEATKPVPILLYISFRANSMAVDDPGIKEGFIWNREGQKIPANKGRRFKHMNVPDVLAKGFGFATVYYGDIEPDFQDGAKHGVRRLFPKTENTQPAHSTDSIEDLHWREPFVPLDSK